jgi:hypothetical protein
MELRDFVVFLVLQTVMEFERIAEFMLGYVSFGWFRLGYVGNTVRKICFVFDFILHTGYTIVACAFTSILLSLSLADIFYFTADTNATPASFQGVSVDF